MTVGKQPREEAEDLDMLYVKTTDGQTTTFCDTGSYHIHVIVRAASIKVYNLQPDKFQLKTKELW